MTSRHWLIALVGVMIISIWPLFLGRFYAIGDMRDVFIPIEHFYHQELIAGRLPSWWPEAAWGFPVIAAAQIGFFYPPLLALRWLPLPIYFPVILSLHVVALAMGMWLLLRKLSCSQSAAYLGAISFALSQFVWQHFTHLNIILALTWLPWQFLAAQYFIQYPSFKKKYFYWLALTIGAPFLVGQLQIPLLMAIVTCIYLSIGLWHQWRNQSQRLLPIGAIIAGLALLSCGLAAAQLLPTAELAQYSSRGSSGDYSLTQANQHSFPLYHLQTALWPRFFGSDNTYWGKRLEIEYGFFIGTIPLLLALWASYRYYRQYRWWVWLAGISFLLALGNLSPFRLLKLEPSLWVFSAPARWLVFTTFAGSVLAAGGFDHLQESSVAFKKLLGRVTIILLIVVAVSNIAIFNLDRLLPLATQVAHLDGEYYAQKLHSLIHSVQTSSISLSSPYTWLSLMVLAVSWLALRTKNMRLLLGIITAELLVVAMTTTLTLPWSTILNAPSSLTTLPLQVRDHSTRLLSIRPAGGDTGAWLTNPESRVDMIGREQQRQLLVPLVHTQFGILGAEWPASLDLNGDSAALDAIKNGSDNQPDLQRAGEYNIGAVIQLDSTGAVIATPVDTLPRASYQLRADTFDRATSIPAVYNQVTPEHVIITVTAPQTGSVVIRDTWFPGWVATVNGQSAPINRAQSIFRAVPVPAGQSTVDLQYRPQALFRGVAISVLTWLLLMVCLWWSNRRAIPSHN